MESGKSGFFAVGRDTFIKACELGVNPGTAFLVMARGSGGDNVTTSWSAEAVSKRLGVRWATANAAVKALVEAGITPTMESKRPTYKLGKEGDLIWLPNQIVDGAKNEVPPVLKLRQMQDAMALRLFSELYASQNLREDGGVSKDVVYRSFDRERIGQQGTQVVWYFTHKSTSFRWGPVTEPHRRTPTSKSEKADTYFAGKAFWDRLGKIEAAGLIEWVPYLFEGPEGEAIHPLAWSGMDIERALYGACREAGAALLTRAQEVWLMENRTGGWLVPAPAYMGEVTMIGLMRLRYRPHTRMTSAWWADYSVRCAQFTAAYRGIRAKALGLPEGLGEEAA